MLFFRSPSHSGFPIIHAPSINTFCDAARKENLVLVFWKQDAKALQSADVCYMEGEV
jgi:hypothetical protein